MKSKLTSTFKPTFLYVPIKKYYWARTLNVTDFSLKKKYYYSRKTSSEESEIRQWHLFLLHTPREFYAGSLS